MIPLFVILRIHAHGHRKFGLWLPLFLVWLLLLPLAILLLAIFVIGCIIARMNPWRVFVAGWQLLTGLRGTHIEFEQEQNKVLLRIF